MSDWLLYLCVAVVLAVGAVFARRVLHGGRRQQTVVLGAGWLLVAMLAVGMVVAFIHRA